MLNKNTYQKNELLVDESVITINVKDPLFDEAGGFYSYLIYGSDKLGTFEIRRRFNQFYFLRDGLCKRWPGCYIPPIPGKKSSGNQEPRFIEDRRRFLQYFLVRTAQIRHLYYCEIFQQFLRNKSASIESMAESIAKLPISQLAPFYKQIFGPYLYKETTGDLKTKINNFSTYLKKSQKELQTLKEQVREISNAKRAFNENLLVCNSILMPEYQKQIFVLYVDGQESLLPYANDNEVNQKIRQIRDQITLSTSAIEYLVDLICFQQKEVIAMQEAIQVSLVYQQRKKKLQEKKKDEQLQLSKLMSGKTTFKSFFTKGNKNQQINILEKSILEDQKQIEYLNILIDSISVILGYIQINKYKKNKQIQYKQILNKMAKTESKYLGIYGGLMKGLILSNGKIKIQP